MDCRSVAELLPWLLNGTLESAERSEVIAHLRACPDCRVELAATGAAFDLFDPHPAAADLVALAFDAAGDRPELQAHLAGCAQCRDELALVRANRGLEALLPTTSRLRLARPLPIAAAAAILVVGIGIGIIAGRGGRLAELETPRLNIPVVELFPASATRGTEEPAAVAASSGEVAVILATELRPPLPELRLDLVDANGRRRYSLTRLERQATSDFTVLLPLSALPAGDLRLELAGLTAGEWRVLETYRLRVLPPGDSVRP